jgi:hypothetical protein
MDYFFWNRLEQSQNSLRDVKDRFLTDTLAVNNYAWVGHSHKCTVEFIATSAIPANNRQTRIAKYRIVVILFLLFGI